jgi:hypothetical protein
VNDASNKERDLAVGFIIKIFLFEITSPPPPSPPPPPPPPPPSPSSSSSSSSSSAVRIRYAGLFRLEMNYLAVKLFVLLIGLFDSLISLPQGLYLHRNTSHFSHGERFFFKLKLILA